MIVTTILTNCPRCRAARAVEATLMMDSPSDGELSGVGDCEAGCTDFTSAELAAIELQAWAEAEPEWCADDE